MPGGLDAVASNGIVTDDSDNESLRIVSNLNGMPDSANGYFEDPDVEDTDEDLKFLMYVDDTLGQRYIVRYERNGSNQTTVLANRIDSLSLSLLRRESHLQHDCRLRWRVRHHECG